MIKSKIVDWLYYLNRKGFFLAAEHPIVIGKKYLIRYKTTYDRVFGQHLIDLNYFEYLKGEFHHVDLLFKGTECLVTAERGGVVSNKRILKNTFLNCWGYIYKAGIYKYLLFVKPEKNMPIINKGFLLAGNMSSNYFHFLIDSFPRIVQFLELKQQHPDLVLIINYPTDFARQYLALLDVQPYDIVWINEDVWVRQLYYTNNKFAQSDPEAKWPNFIYSRYHLKEMAEMFIRLAGTKVEKQQFPDKIYISREKVGTRIMLNEEEIVKAIKPMGIDKVYLEDYSVADQIILMSQAKVVLAIHGAGLTNLIYVSNALVVELFPHNKKLSTLYQMHQLGQLGSNRHILYVCDNVSEEQNILLDVDAFMKALSEEMNF